MLAKAGRLFLIVFVFFFLSTTLYVVYLKWFPPFSTPLMLKRAMEAKGDFSLKCKWRSYKNISDYAKLAAIASEDQAFPTHNGFDIKAIKEAIKYNSKHKTKMKGASTISQQVAKNVFLYPSRTYLRKGLEAYFTIMIETIWGKKRILEMYLNVAEMGNGIFGVEAASEKYYHRNAKDITAIQAATLAAILPSPIEHPANNLTIWVTSRRDDALKGMRQIGGLNYLNELN